MRRFTGLAVLAALVAGSGTATASARTPTFPPPASRGPSGPAKPSRMFDGISTQAGKRWVFWFTTTERGWFLGESGNAAFAFPRGTRCSTNGRAARWVALPRALDHFSLARVRPGRAGTFRYRYRFRHPQDRRITLRQDLSGRFSEGGTALSMRYRWVSTKPGRHCNTGWVSARASLLRYTATAPDGVSVEFEVKNRLTTVTGEPVPNLEGVISGVVPGCRTPDGEYPPVTERWTGVSGDGGVPGSVALSTEFPILPAKLPGWGNPPPHPAGFLVAPGVPAENDRFFPWATGPAQITGTLGLSWVGTSSDEGCPSAETQIVLRRIHPELAVRLPRPRAAGSMGAR